MRRSIRIRVLLSTLGLTALSVITFAATVLAESAPGPFPK
jgi:hypothetical protein